jgi:hypothetical protein
MGYYSHRSGVEEAAEDISSAAGDPGRIQTRQRRPVVINEGKFLDEMDEEQAHQHTKQHVVIGEPLVIGERLHDSEAVQTAEYDKNFRLHDTSTVIYEHRGQDQTDENHSHRYLGRRLLNLRFKDRHVVR